MKPVVTLTHNVPHNCKYESIIYHDTSEGGVPTIKECHCLLLARVHTAKHPCKYHVPPARTPEQVTPFIKQQQRRAERMAIHKQHKRLGK